MSQPCWSDYSSWKHFDCTRNTNSWEWTLKQILVKGWRSPFSNIVTILGYGKSNVVVWCTWRKSYHVFEKLTPIRVFLNCSKCETKHASNLLLYPTNNETHKVNSILLLSTWAVLWTLTKDLRRPTNIYRTLAVQMVSSSQICSEIGWRLTNLNPVRSQLMQELQI